MAAYGTVEGPWWSDAPVAIVNDGPSVLDLDLQKLRGAHVLAVKGAIFDMPWADAGFGLDWSRFETWQNRLCEVSSRVYWAVDRNKIAQCPKAANITYLERQPGVAISNDPGVICNGGTSGFGALQLALHKRARKIALFGFDYSADWRLSAISPETKRRKETEHWHEWAQHFQTVEWVLRTREVEVVNACFMSQITAFPKVSVDDAVRYLHR
jgi:hypothetical protein